MTQHLNYNNDVSHMKGQTLQCPRLTLGGGMVEVRWHITDVVYDPTTNKSHVELERVNG